MRYLAEPTCRQQSPDPAESGSAGKVQPQLWLRVTAGRVCAVSRSSRENASSGRSSYHLAIKSLILLLRRKAESKHTAITTIECTTSQKYEEMRQKTYNSWNSSVVTDPATTQPISSLCMAERTGCPVFLSLWSYVIGLPRL